MSERPALPAALHLGPVHVTVSDLARSIDYYERAIGLRVHSDSAGEAALGSGGPDVLVLTEQANARRAGRHAGLYHFALLLPSREELAQCIARIGASGEGIDGASDHGTHEALYLSDPDGNGIELAADRPREQWPDVRSVSGYAGGPQPLDTPGLMALLGDGHVREHVGPGLAVGHLHLHVGDIQQGLDFYCGVIGFDLMVNLGSAAFVSAGGYHHHLGFNVWRGHGVGPAAPGTVGLRHWAVHLPTQADVDDVAERVQRAGIETEHRHRGFQVRDPWDIALLVAVHGDDGSPRTL